MARQGLRRYLTGSVPISIGLHLVALLLCLVIPLTARIVLPMVSVDLPEYVRLAPMPPPPQVAVRTPPPAGDPVPSRAPQLAPTSAPSTIHPELESLRRVEIPDSVGASGGLPTDLGALPNMGISPPVMAAPPQPPRGPVRLADLPVAPRKIVDIRPNYPDIARQAKKEGTVVMEAVLDTTGRVTQLRVIRSVPLLDQAALDAVRQWRYTPTTLGGHPVAVLMTIAITFTLQ
jgi:periplasmic protein TonB